MHPYPIPNPDLDAAMSRLGMGTRWSPERSLASSWQPSSSALSGSNTGSSPAPSRDASAADPLSARLSPSSPSSLTDRDISRRTLAASGLDVSAPEFVPAFVKAAPPHSSPLHSPPPFVPMQPPSQNSFQPALPHSPSLYEPVPPPHAQQFFHRRHRQHQILQQNNLHAYYHDDHAYPPNNSNHHSYFPTSPNAPFRPAHLDEATYVTAVQHFDEQFPALAKTDNTTNPPPSVSSVNPRWSSDNNHPSSNPAPAPEAIQSIFPKALGWDALQREEDRKKRDADAARRWQAELEEYTRSLDNEYDDVYDEEDIRLSDDIGALWVSTGQSVGHMYQSLRAEAAEEARLRNKYFDRAAAAFKRNDGATAKKLGALGRDANERMKELHRQAAEAIFEARNPPLVTDVVDLHGLHVSEALDRLPSALEKAPPGILRILTGTGHHTKGTGRARLRPAVKKWLQENGYFFEEVIDANEYVGSFKVEIVR